MTGERDEAVAGAGGWGERLAWEMDAGPSSSLPICSMKGPYSRELMNFRWKSTLSQSRSCQVSLIDLASLLGPEARTDQQLQKVRGLDFSAPVHALIPFLTGNGVKARMPDSVGWGVGVFHLRSYR